MEREMEKKLFGLAIIVVIIVVAAGGIMIKILQSKPAEKAAAAAEQARIAIMEQQLLAVAEGDLVERIDGKIFVVFQVNRDTIRVYSGLGYQTMPEFVDVMARLTKRIIKKTDPPSAEYKMAAVKFINQ